MPICPYANIGLVTPVLHGLAPLWAYSTMPRCPYVQWGIGAYCPREGLASANMWRCQCALRGILAYGFMCRVQSVHRVMLAYVHIPLYTNAVRRILPYTKRGILHYASLHICQCGQMHIWAFEPMGVLQKADMCMLAYVPICMMTE